MVEPTGEGSILAAGEFQLLDAGKKVVFQTTEFGGAFGIIVPHRDGATVAQQKDDALRDNHDHRRPEQFATIDTHLNEVDDTQYGTQYHTHQCFVDE